ncbi:MAG: dehydratase [Rhodoglobus sp.]|nr:dehydratase [Rhodoglobus sp.]
MATFAEPWPLATLASRIGETVGPSEPVLVSQARIDAFAEATEDRQWIHVDPDRAKDSAFGGTIAHGFLTLSLLSHFMDELVVVSGTEMAINYGLDRVRFAAPVPAGSSLRATVTILNVQPKENGVMMWASMTITADVADRPSCIAETVTLYRPIEGETS